MSPTSTPWPLAKRLVDDDLVVAELVSVSGLPSSQSSVSTSLTVSGSTAETRGLPLPGSSTSAWL